MAITTTKDIDTVIGNMRLTGGTTTISGGSTGGDLNTGLHQCLACWFVGAGAAVVADDTSVNETFPCDGSAVTIVTTANAPLRWFALGY